MAEINATISKKTPQLEASLPGTLLAGVPGVSPVVSILDIDGGHRVTITDEIGEKSFDVMNGKDGTSVTVEDVLAALPTWTGGSY